MSGIKRLRNDLRRAELLLKNSAPFSLRQQALRVFYPGCSLVGADPHFCVRLIRELRRIDAEIGVWFDCCSKPSRLAQDDRFAQRQEETLLQRLRRAGVKEVLVACGNCYTQLQRVAGDDIRVRMLYDFLPSPDPLEDPGPERVIHHPCFARIEPQLQQGALRISDALGLRLRNRNQSEHPLPCCLRSGPAAQRKREALAGQELLSYCAHCVMRFQPQIPSRHLLQELFGSDERWQPQGKLSLFRRYRLFCRLLQAEGRGRSLSS